jgi:hypothetical protein
MKGNPLEIEESCHEKSKHNLENRKGFKGRCIKTIMKKRDVRSCVVKENINDKKRMIEESSSIVISSNNMIHNLIEKMKQIDMKLSFLL